MRREHSQADERASVPTLSRKCGAQQCGASGGRGVTVLVLLEAGKESSDDW